MIENTLQKQLIVVGGPNGAGKTTLALEILAEKNIEYISADDIAYELAPENTESVRIQAGKEFFKRLELAVQHRKNILIESTLSGKTLLPILCRYQKNYDYSIVIVFVYTPNSDFCAERVAIRVKKGGHNVPLEDLKRRFDRSLNNFWHVYRPESDQWYLYYNAEDDFQEVARFINNDLYVLDESLFVTFKQMV
ncbi:MAG TPA: AAA family ATPase [Balneolales bacterium]|nr:AAA family ATPase [Balneolales bacterium]